MTDLEQTINAADCDLVLIGTPIDLTRLLKINKPSLRVSYDLKEQGSDDLKTLVEKAVRN